VIITIYVCIGTLQHANPRWTFGPAVLLLAAQLIEPFRAGG
jgi:hypothetical protein